jgi:hypothetical protein
MEIPGLTERKRAVLEALKALDEPGQGPKETYRLTFRGSPLLLPVINLPLKQVLLNPNTHRLRAQMESDPRAAKIKESMYSDASQHLIAEMLREDPSNPGKIDDDFVELRDDIKDRGQLDPGVVSRDGVLFNGNTRAVALRDLKNAYVRVAVLPPNASAEDFDVLELTLQVQKDLKRDYSFANELLMIEEQIDRYEKPIDEVAKLLNRRPRTVQQLLWILQQIRKMQAMSATMINGTESRLPLTFFNDHQGKLEELYRTYQSLGKKDPAGADRMQLARLLGVVLKKSKTDLRFVDEGFYSGFLATRLSANAKQSPPSATASSAVRHLPGTKIPVPKTSDPDANEIQSILQNALQAATVVESGADIGASKVEEAKNLLSGADKAYDGALQTAGKQVRLLKRAVEPINKMEDAAEAVEACRLSLIGLTETEAPDWQDFDEQCDRLRKSLVGIAQILGRRPDLQSAELEALAKLTSSR